MSCSGRSTMSDHRYEVLYELEGRLDLPLTMVKADDYRTALLTFNAVMRQMYQLAEGAKPWKLVIREYDKEDKGDWHDRKTYRHEPHTQNATAEG